MPLENQDGANPAPHETRRSVHFTPKGSIQTQAADDGLWFTTTRSQPHNFRHKGVTANAYMEAEGPYRLPLRIDLSVTLDAPGLCVMLGDTGRVHFCSTWDDNRRIEDIAGPALEGKSMAFANQMPLHVPVDITILYNLASMQVLINGAVRYHSTRERYMKSPAFAARNADGFPLRLTCYKRTGVTIHACMVTEREADFDTAPAAAMPDPVVSNIALRPGDKPAYANIVAALGGKPTFEAMTAGLPGEVRAKVMEMDAYLRAFKPFKFRRTLEKNGNKVSYVASQAGVSYAVYLSRDMLTHSVQWYILTNSRENWGKRVANDLEATLERLAAEDAAFAARMFSYLQDCVGCYGPGCGARTPYTFAGKTKQTCHGRIEFTMALSEFDDVRRFIEAIP